MSLEVEMEYKSVFSEVKQVEGRVVTGIAAVTGNVDDGFDRIWKGAFKKSIAERLGRVRHLWQHDMHNPPIATIEEMKEVGVRELPEAVREKYPEATGGLLVKREYLDTPRGNEVLAGIASGAINEMSFAYDPVKFDFETLTPDPSPSKGEGGVLVRNLRELRLWDTSDVNWGMNPATVASKMAMAFKDTGVAEEGASWSEPQLEDFTDESWEDLSEGEKRRIAEHFCLGGTGTGGTGISDPGYNTGTDPGYKRGTGEGFEGCRLAHHQAGKSGVGRAVWKGVEAAMGALMGLTTDVKRISGWSGWEGDRRAVYNHLKRHYEQFGKDAPDYRLVELAADVKRISGWNGWEGLDERAWPARKVERLKGALEQLDEILRSAEPPEPERALALTGQVLRRLAIAERELRIYSG